MAKSIMRQKAKIVTKCKNNEMKGSNYDKSQDFVYHNLNFNLNSQFLLTLSTFNVLIMTFYLIIMSLYVVIMMFCVIIELQCHNFNFFILKL